MITRRGTMLSKYLLLWSLMYSSIIVICASVETIEFSIVKGQRVSSGGFKIGQITRSDMTSISCARFCGSVCGMFEYSAVTGDCKIYREKNYDAGVVLTSHSDWTVSYRVGHATVEQGDWTLVFRAQSGIGVPVWDTWSNAGVHNDNPISEDFPHACLRLKDYSSCDRHFRSHILDNWIKIKEVRLAVTKSNKEVAFILFNGTGTDYTSWFDQAKILDSTWSPAIVNEPYLVSPGVFGYVDHIATRRFYLGGPQHGCEWDTVYIMASDITDDGCVTFGLWHVTWAAIPALFYSPSLTGIASYRIDRAYPMAQKADVFSVWVKFA